MAQPTGCESTELHAEEETTPREGATPRRASSRDSETTIVESVFTTLDHSTMANATKRQLVNELRAREPTDSSTKDQAAYDDDRQAHLETLSADNARLCAELSSLRAQLNRATTSERETLHEAHQNASLPTERVTTPTLGLHHSVPADITMSSGSTPPPSLNDGNNQDAARTAAPTVSTHEGEPSMAQILAALVNTQALLANTLSRGKDRQNKAKEDSDTQKALNSEELDSEERHADEMDVVFSSGSVTKRTRDQAAGDDQKENHTSEEPTQKAVTMPRAIFCPKPNIPPDRGLADKEPK
ncbi:hypothetical protein HPB51_001136 [Rhipicephalus microplus]|uniref:Uncharacterized protein n=1 Tax=Rhipicephalus microplus TaxID=6941 RepID=A0A9J6EVP1_RHIMP|nr:hypothetical protein HPB51_001136 [Rhipicephalus microplus]